MKRKCHGEAGIRPEERASRELELEQGHIE
jgi:hypothetical protein